MSDILVVGSANMDLVAFANRLPIPGETLLGGDFQSFAGGKGANQAVAAARSSGRDNKVAFLGCVGSDQFGVLLDSGLRENGVDTRFLRKIEGVSGVAIIMSGGGNNMIVVAPGANDTVTAATIHAAAFEGTRFVLAQLETPLDGVVEAARLAHNHGATFILDPAPARNLPPGLLAQVGWLTPNESEACLLLGVTELDDPMAAAHRLKALGPRGVVLKLGGRGAVLLEDDVPVFIPAYAVTVADTTAAGDTFNGAFAVALSEGRTPQDAVRFAMAAAAVSVTRPGAQSAMGTRGEIDAFIARCALPAPASG